MPVIFYPHDESLARGAVAGVAGTAGTRVTALGRLARGAGTTMLEGRTAEPDHIPVLTKIAFNAQLPRRVVVLEVLHENRVTYSSEATDPTTLASAPQLVPSGPLRTFQEFIGIGDRVSVNGKPARGVWKNRVRERFSQRTNSPPGVFLKRLGGYQGIEAGAKSGVEVFGPGWVHRFAGHGILLSGTTTMASIKDLSSNNCFTGIQFGTGSQYNDIEGNVAARNGNRQFTCGGICTNVKNQKEMEMNTQRITRQFTRLLALGAVAVGLAPQVLRAQNPQCPLGNATMNGTYVASGTGTVVGVGPIASVGLVIYNGDGTGMLVSITQSVNGATSTANNIPATFTVNRDCTGTKTIGTNRFNFVMTPDGDTITWIVTNPGVTLMGTGVRVRR